MNSLNVRKIRIEDLLKCTICGRLIVRGLELTVEGTEIRICEDCVRYGGKRCRNSTAKKSEEC